MYYSVRHDQKSNFHTDDAEQMEGKGGTRETTAVGKQMEMEVREELWRKCAMPAACLHRGELQNHLCGRQVAKFFAPRSAPEKEEKHLFMGIVLQAERRMRTIGRSVGLGLGQARQEWRARAPIAVFQFHTISGPVSTPLIFSASSERCSTFA